MSGYSLEPPFRMLTPEARAARLTARQAAASPDSPAFPTAKQMRRKPPTLAEMRQQELMRRKARYLGGQDFNEWLEDQAGDDSVFTETDWSEVDPDISVPVGADGIFPAYGVVWAAGLHGSGKTTQIYWAALQRVRAGEHCGICDNEMGKARIKRLLLNLGATDREIARFHHAETEGVPNLLANGRVLARWAEDRECKGVIFDSVAPLLGVAGLSENDAPDIRRFVNAAGTPISDFGGTAWFIDHEGLEGGRARGSTGKGDAADFYVNIEQTVPFARGVAGQMAIKVNKDRDGKLAKGATMLVDVPARSDGLIELVPDAWNNGSIAEPRVGGTQGRIITLIGELGRPVGLTEMARKLDLKYDAVRKASGRAVRSGHLIKDQDKYDLPAQ